MNCYVFDGWDIHSIIRFHSHSFKIKLQPFSSLTSNVQNFSLAVHPFDLIRSKIFHSCSSVRPHPFKNILQPFIRSTSSVQKFSAAVHPFDLIRSTVQCNRFERFLEPFLIRSLAVHSSVRTDTVRNVFAWEVTYLFFKTSFFIHLNYPLAANIFHTSLVDGAQADSMTSCVNKPICNL